VEISFSFDQINNEQMRNGKDTSGTENYEIIKKCEIERRENIFNIVLYKEELVFFTENILGYL